MKIRFYQMSESLKQLILDKQLINEAKRILGRKKLTHQSLESFVAKHLNKSSYGERSALAKT